jgi:hypothetical protein
VIDKDSVNKALSPAKTINGYRKFRAKFR